MGSSNDDGFATRLFMGKRFLVVSALFTGLFSMTAMFWAKSCSKSNHMKAAVANYEKADWLGALHEATLQLEVEPDSSEALVMIADSHAALADAIQGDFWARANHVCAALHFYELRLSKGFISTVRTKQAILEERYQEMTSPEGKYVRCNDDGEAEEPTE